MHLNSFELTLWLFPTGLEIVIVAVMICRRLWRTLPVFLAFLIFAIVRTCFLFSQRNHEVMYFLGYWISEALGNVAELLVIKELFNRAFEDRLGLRKQGNTLFRWSIGFLLIIAAAVAWYSPGGDIHKLMAGIWIIRRTVAIIEAGSLFLLFVYMFVCGISWRNYLTGVFLGLSLYGAVDVIATTVRAIEGERSTKLIGWAIMSANNLSVLIWAASIFAPQPKPLEPSIDVEEARDELDALTQGVSAFRER